MTLAQFALDESTGRPKFGALARIAEHLGCAKASVRSWALGIRAPKKDTQRRIDAMLKKQISLAPRKTGRPFKKRAKRRK